MIITPTVYSCGSILGGVINGERLHGVRSQKTYVMLSGVGNGG